MYCGLCPQQTPLRDGRTLLLRTDQRKSDGGWEKIMQGSVTEKNIVQSRSEEKILLRELDCQAYKIYTLDWQFGSPCILGNLQLYRLATRQELYTE